MNSKKNNIEAQIVEDFEKIRPAITRLLQTQLKNDDLSIRYGRSKSNSKNDIVINPSILVSTISKTSLKIVHLNFKQFINLWLYQVFVDMIY